jgi:mannosyltransferase
MQTKILLVPSIDVLWPKIARKSHYSLIFLLLLAIGMYFYGLGAESLAEDEFFSLRDATSLNPDALKVRPVFYLLLHVWMQFGSSEEWLRGLSVAFSLGSVLLIYGLGRRLMGTATGLTAAVLLTLSPLHIYNAQEIRMYMVSLFFGLAGTLFFAKALEKPKHTYLAGWAIFRLLANLTYPLCVTLLLADAFLCFFVFRKRPQTIWRFGAWAALIVILWSPFFLNLLSATPEFMDGWVEVVSAPTPRKVIGLLKIFTIRWWSRSLTNSPTLIGQLSDRFEQVYSLFALVTILWGLRYWKRSPKIGWILAWAMIPIGAIFLYSQSGESLWVFRYLMFASPYFLLLIAFGFTQLWQRQRQLAIVCALIYAVGISGGLHEYYMVQEKDDWRATIQVINEQEKSGDVILTYTGRYAFDYYYEGDNPLYEMPGDALTIKEPLTSQTTETALDEFLPQSDSRLWLLYRHRGSLERHDVFQAVVQDKLAPQQQWSFQGMDLFLIDSPNPKGGA